MRLILLIWISNIFTVPTLTAESVDENSAFNYKHFQSIAYITFGNFYSISSDEFFKIYKSIGGKDNYFETASVFGGGLKFQINQGFRVGIYIQKVKDNIFNLYQERIPTQGIRHISEEIIVETIPILLTIDYVPQLTQFRTYLGCGIGFSSSNLSWIENVNSNIPNDQRKGGTYFDEQTYYPSLSIYAGLELGFDKNYLSTFLGHLIFEARINFINRSTKFFEGIDRQFNNSIPASRGEISIIPIHIGMNIGITFNLQQREILAD